MSNSRSIQVLALLFACVITTSVRGQQTTTEWTSSDGDWFKRENWSAGVPNAFFPAVIANGTANAAGTTSPVAAGLRIGQGSLQSASNASLNVSGTFLDINGDLDVGRSSGGSVNGLLETNGGLRQIGDVIVRDDVTIGHVTSSFSFFFSATASGKVAIDGNLLIRDNGEIPNLTIGTLAGNGTVAGDAVVTGNVGREGKGYQSVVVGVIGSNGSGNSTGNLSAQGIYGAGANAFLRIGSSTGSGHASGSVTANEISGFNSILIGDASNVGTAFGRLDINGSLSQVLDIDVGNKQGTGVGELHFGPSASFKGRSITINEGSQFVATNVVDGEVFNLGRFDVLDPARGQPSVVFMENFSQTTTGVTTLDVRSLDGLGGYDSIRVEGAADIAGRIDVRFDDDFKPSFDQQLRLISAGNLDPNNYSLRLINPPADVALVPFFGGGIDLSFAKPEPLEFLNPNSKEQGWSDDANWPGGRAPTTLNPVALLNNQSFEQTVVVKGVAEAQSLQIGGVSPINLVLPEGQTLNVTHDISVDPGGKLTLDEGRVFASQVNVQSGGSLFADGLVAANVTNQGLMSIGNGSGSEAFMIDGNLTQTAGGIIELDVLGENSDQVTIDGVGDLDGNIVINMPTDFLFPGGVEIPLITATEGIFGDFGIEIVNGALQDRDIFLGFDDGTVIMTISNDIPGLDDLADLNDDGIRDEIDVLGLSLALRDISQYYAHPEFNGLYPVRRADANGDGELDFDDIEPFLTCIDEGICLGFDFAAPVPEPNSFFLAALAFVGLVGVRRKSRQMSLPLNGRLGS